MFERFTDRARRVVVLAQEESRLLNHDYIGTEHLLLGLLHERDGVACQVLESVGVSLEEARQDVKEITGKGKKAPTGHIPFTPGAKKVLEMSLREALQFGHNYIGTEHILLGLIRQGEGVAAQVLSKRGVEPRKVREQVVALVAMQASGADPGAERVHLHQPTTRGPFTAGMGFLGSGPQPKLLRVVPLARQVEVGEGAHLVLLSLEIWSNWLDLRLATVGAAASGPATAYGDWTLDDDLGTSYRTAGVSFSGNQELQVCQVSFTPGPPEQARTLTLKLAGAGEGEGEAAEEIRVVVELAA